MYDCLSDSLIAPVVLVNISKVYYKLYWTSNDLLPAISMLMKWHSWSTSVMIVVNMIDRLEQRFYPKKMAAKENFVKSFPF